MTNVFSINPANARQSAAAYREKNLCAICECPPVLRDELEEREYTISACCGPCWDECFGTGE
jgi:hypothetical protein